MTDALNAQLTMPVSVVLSIEHDERIALTADGTAIRGYETYIREYVGMIESGLMARLSNAAYKTLHALALRARILGDPRRRGAEEEFRELERLGIVSPEDKGHLFCFPSREQLMQDTGMGSVHTVDSALDELADSKIVKRITPAQPRITRGLFGSNVYIIHPESFIGKFGTRDGEQKVLPVEGTESSLRHSENCPLKKKDCTTTTTLKESPEILRLVKFFARAIGVEHYAPTEKEMRLLAALLVEDFSIEQIESDITRAIERAREKNRTANLSYCARFVRHPEDQRSRRESNRASLRDPWSASERSKSSGEIVTARGKSSTQIVTASDKSSAQIVPVGSDPKTALFDELGLDEPTRAEMVRLIALVEEHSGQKLSTALVKRWKTLADEFQALAVQRDLSAMSLVRQAVEEALDAGSAKKGFCAPKLARVILTRWAKESKQGAEKKDRTAKREIHPAVQVYRQVHQRYPAKGSWDKIAQIVGIAESDLAFWREVLSTWSTRGYNPMNVAGPLEWFLERAIPKNGNRMPSSDNVAVPQRPIETLETIQERLGLAARVSAPAEESSVSMSEGDSK
ncbi:MAG: hypothetical protein HZB51_22760 [Chloroflexi bacterium]|nr:hypothetical protein [Chloroflexota bacterium]